MSRIKTAVAALHDSDGRIPEKDFIACIASMCETKGQMRNLRNDMMKRGLIRLDVTLTEKGVEYLRRQNERHW